jgi:hypothetical protein
MEYPLSQNTTQELFREILFNEDVVDRDDIFSVIYVQLLLNSGENLEQLFFDNETEILINLERLKQTTKLNRNANEMWCDKECGICLENFKKNEYVRTLSCSHYFHKKCVDKWFKNTMTCPSCRAII